MWHTSPVTLHWIFDSGLVSPVSGTACASGKDLVVSDDTSGTELTCSVTSVTSGTLTQTATVRVDQTPPEVTGAVPARPPDHDGWYNHPVAFAFTGSDATSGVAGCEIATYAGPDTATGNVAGMCHDVAGNAGAGTRPLKYDATPPTITPIPQKSKEGEVNLKWNASPDAVEYSVTRDPGRNGSKPSTVYTGTSPSYTDTDVVQNQSYTYTITGSDAAANSSSVAVVTVAGGSQTVIGIVRDTAPPLSAPTKLGIPIPAAVCPRLSWRRVRHADYYNVQVYRAGRKILSAWPAGTHLQLRPSWRFRGRRFHLAPGRHYHWYAWPGFGSRRMHRFGRLIAHKGFTVRRTLR
jgi:hypothetical protein